jgi:uncharacterized iron-regulated membrane protein
MGSPAQTPDQAVEGTADKPRGFFTRWMRRPQSTWLRKAIFQIHLWSGMILGLYIVIVCVSGSALVYRNDVYTVFEDWDRAGTVPSTTHWIRLSYDVFRWMGDLHGKLLLGVNGMLVNAIGGFLTAGVCLTGRVIWWPGVARWKRALILTRGVGWKRLNFDLHSSVGFWTFAFLFMWGMTGGYFVYPQPFRAVINYFTPIDAPLPPRTAPVGTNPAGANSAGANPVRQVAGASAPVNGTVQRPQAALTTGVSGPNAATVPAPGPAVAKDAAVSKAAGASENRKTQALLNMGATRVAPSSLPRRRSRPLTKGGKILQWFSFLHYGNFAGWKTKLLWLLLGLVPVVLYATAIAMWWNRVVSPFYRRRRSRPEWVQAPAAVAPELEWDGVTTQRISRD